MSTVGLLGKKRRNRLKIMAKNLSKVIQKKKPLWKEVLDSRHAKSAEQFFVLATET